ncbi:hypothetical protein [Streptomyces microflavus]|uniref:hypothetical protein n=1 Tax=Streptomyces microflavus TaxID=1919 RepID=UPI003864BB6C|nr:hypothetical protein OH770_17155 [Streptomyces microflavus]
MSLRERLTRTLHAAGLRLAGEHGGRAANVLTGLLGLGRIELCTNPACTDCAPAPTTR